MATRTKKQKEEKPKQVFPDQGAFDYFIEDTKKLLEGLAVHDEDIEAMVKEWTEWYGQNLPKESAWELDET